MKKRLIRIIISIAVFAAAFFIKAEYVKLGLFVLCCIIVGYDVLWKALRNIIRGKVFDENFLMSLAVVGAFIVGEYPEAAAVMLFYQIGELFQSYAVGRSRRSIRALMDIRPDRAEVKRGDGFETVPPEEVLVGDIIRVKPGERVPLDGTVTDGESFVDTSAITGEAVPRRIKSGDKIISGCINQSGALFVSVEKTFGESTVSRILELTENSVARKSRSESFITRFAAWYTPAVVAAALLLAFLPPIFDGNFKQWIYRALSFLVVSCPCALVISVPLSFFGGIGGASRAGILVKGGIELEKLSKTETAVFDKTGTLTKGEFKVLDISSDIFSDEEMLEKASSLEAVSLHPIALSVLKAYGKMPVPANNIEELSGMGIKGIIDGKEAYLGNERLMEKAGIKLSDTLSASVYMAYDGKYAGSIKIGDEIKEDAKEGISELYKLGVKKTVMLTGDSKEAGEEVSKKLGMDACYCELLPEGKLNILEKLISECSLKGKTVFIGDGINDAPVLARADIGIAMGGVGSDAAIESADVVIMTDEISKVGDAVRISRKTLKIVNENIAFALFVKILVLVLCALGLTGMWAAVFADVGVSVLAVLNALRTLKYKKKGDILKMRNITCKGE